MGKTARYRVVSSVCLGGGEDVYAGDELELEEARARPLEQTGFLARIAEPAAVQEQEELLEEESPEPAASDDADFGDPEAEHGDPEAENQDPRPRRGRRR